MLSVVKILWRELSAVCRHITKGFIVPFAKDVGKIGMPITVYAPKKMAKMTIKNARCAMGPR